jgi:hypothetical protein
MFCDLCAVSDLDGGCEHLSDEQTGEAAVPHGRRVTLTAASTIKPRRVRWLWTGRIALGTLSLLAGPEGLGKSTLGYWLAARITEGSLPGEYAGTPRGVLIAASEDSWSHTIVPRLMAAGADLDRVFRIEVVTTDELHMPLTLPRDVDGVRRAALEVEAALLLLDPLTSRVDDKLDTHRDAETRRALEPLAALANDAGMGVLGLMHHNKSGATDPLQLVMASKAFTAVARSVHTVIRDPDDETGTGRLFGTSKNNLGSSELPVLRFQVDGHTLDTDDGPAETGKLRWTGEAAGTIGDAVRRGGESSDDRSAVSEAADWLSDWLVTEGGRAPSTEIKRAGKSAGHSEDSLKRARKTLGLTVESVGFPRATYWCSPAAQSEQPQSAHSRSTVRGESPTALTDSLLLRLDNSGTETPQSVQSEQSEQTGETLPPLTDAWQWPVGSAGASR